MKTHDLPFARNTAILLVAGGLALLAVVLTSLWLTVGVARSSDAINQAQETRLHANRLLSLLQDAETGQRGYLLTREDVYLEPYNRAQAGMKAELDIVTGSLAKEGHSKDAGELSGLAFAKMYELSQTVALTKQGKEAEALAIVRSDQGKKLMDSLRATIANVVQKSDTRIRSSMGALRGGAAVLRNVTLGGGVLTVIFVLGAGLASFRYTRDMIEARRQVQELNRDLEDRVAARTADLTRANDEIQRFAYIVSHDLRSPLVNIMGFTSELEDGAEAVREYFEKPEEERTDLLKQTVQDAATDDMPTAIRFIRTSTNKMDGLINAILKLSREGGRTLLPEPVDLNGLIERQGGSIRHQLDASQSELVIENELPTITSDRMALEQVFANLIDNAVKYLAKDRPGRIVVRSKSEGSRVAIEVEDNGRGISKDDFERIFELFRRSGAQDRPGEGIGLAHVRALVRRLGGEINVESRLHEGSVFRVTLPRTLRAAGQETA